MFGKVKLFETLQQTFFEMSELAADNAISETFDISSGTVKQKECSGVTFKLTLG